ncbi:G1/S-specific cyclin-D2-like [Daktulosphaira vitifoliae]|uniref:G1/S-specific cyclin-D2-like n=1 Tax=Daktulosphaira vitifoliae TaxID=58002 RepID=UPI0021AAA1C2|nr:G1/S-specific cyclin-D2-like [Daktulosphaira vitifoliae]
MNLMCTESRAGSEDKCFAQDRTIFRDERAIKKLLETETQYVPGCDYMSRSRSNLQPFMRRVVATWMLDVCEEQNCEDQVFPLSVNFLDRFLCACDISKTHLQLTGAVCLLLASKVRQCTALSIDLLCYYTENSVTAEEMREWELLVISKLEWKIVAVTSFDYVDHIMEQVKWKRRNDSMLRRHMLTLISFCYIEPEFITKKPSVMAASCMLSAIRGIDPVTAAEVAAELCGLLECSTTEVDEHVSLIDALVASTTAAALTPEKSENNNPAMAAEPPLKKPYHSMDDCLHGGL